MKALVQRVKSAKVRVEGVVVGEIGPGILTLLGVGLEDDEPRVLKLIDKISKLRIFEDEAGKMNLALMDLGARAGHLIVSQFTLYGDTSKGNRPSFVGAAPPDKARLLYERALAHSESLGIKTAGGKFQAHMEVELVNDGPVTFILET
jgi:D-tyrosyl-tRNA(Tyr) deacylase